MSRSYRPPDTRPRHKLPVVVIVIVVRGLVFIGVLALAVDLTGRGTDLVAVGGFVSAVVTVASAAAARLTRGVMTTAKLDR
jgi:hypothetical protein